MDFKKVILSMVGGVHVEVKEGVEYMYTYDSIAVLQKPTQH